MDFEQIENHPLILTDYLDVKVKARTVRLGNKVKNLRSAWDDVRDNSTCSLNGNWRGEIDNRLSGFLQTLREFFEWHCEQNPAHRNEFSNILKVFDSRAISLSKPLEDMKYKRWDEIHDFLEGVLHHGRDTDDIEFSKMADSLERFLLDLLTPKTFDDFDRIDELLQ